MRKLALGLCILGIAATYPAVSHATEICYTVYVPTLSRWFNGCDGELAGTVGQSRGTYFVGISAPDPSIGGGSICYQAHVEGFGWLSAVCDGSETGVLGRRLEAVRVTTYTAQGSIQYRAHVGQLGWLPIQPFNGIAGTTGQSRPLEAFEANIHLNGESEFWQNI